MNGTAIPSEIDTVLGYALAASRAAYRKHPEPTLAERRADLQKLKAFVRDHQDAIVAAINADYGARSSHETLLLEIYPVLSGIDHAIAHLKSWMSPRRRPVDWLTFPGGKNTVRPQPLGVVGVIVPWNFPINLSFLPLAYILAAGNRALVKMSENSRNLTRLISENIGRYLPPEKVRFFEETGEVGIAFSRLPLDHLLFTGSGKTGRSVMMSAAANLCPVTLELGGKSPAIVASDFPLRKATERILYVKFLNAGQICTTVDYAFVPRESIASFVAMAREIMPARYPHLDSRDYTSMIDERAFLRITAALEDARARGAQLIQLIDGPAFDSSSRKIAPHIALDLPADSDLLRQEIFGPVLPVLPYDDMDFVIDSINDGPRPLALYPFSNDRNVVDRLISQVMSGGVTINDALFHVGQHDLPFGGVGESGMGHYHGKEGFDSFSKLRPIYRQPGLSPLKYLAPPYGKLADVALKWLLR